jgi:hypothetical protein
MSLSHYLSLFAYLKPSLEDEVASFSEVLRDVSGRELLRFSLSVFYLLQEGYTLL